ncbi:hypothetical protein FQ775_10795 [Nitratireductor mangrovi]|uniref:DUF6455 domain-containing protein n=1 Tax=Nitratireductor mangrovi TaxID=2599600 RepID=A0A5B8KZG4_9HYPH|nr:DUF6455 family protein [Nitratireductor mangrovi]QDZ00830.1 hypothetical protein FQ775_10795 [Nitratireductor mangrovi]
MKPFRIIDRMAAKADLMNNMMEHLGVRDGVARMPDGAAVLRNATLRCLTCGHGQECREWLASDTAHSRAPAYCRNRELFDFVADDA